MNHRWIVILISLCISLLACKGGDGDDTGTAPTAQSRPSGETVALVTAAELDAFERDVTTMAKDNATKVCKRPVLRGQALAGSADEDIEELLFKVGTPCFEAIGKLREGGFTDSIREPSTRGVARARPVTSEEWLTQPVREALATCRDIPEMLRRAVGHEDACSPFLPGRRPNERFMPIVRLGWAVAIRARALVAEKRPIEAAEHIFDYLRLSQDLVRGGGTLLSAMIAMAAFNIVLPELELALNAPMLGAEDAAALAKQFEGLRQTEVSVVEAMESEMIHVGLYMVLPALKDGSWQPPGGYPEGENGRQPLGATAVVDPLERQGQVFTWEAVQRVHARLARSCTPPKTVKQCLDELQAARDRVDGKVEDANANVSALIASMLKAGDRHSLIRRRIVDVLDAVMFGVYPKYVRKYAWRAAALSAFGLALHARINGCDSLEQLDHDILGERLLINREGSRVEVAAPAWLGDDSEGDGPVRLTAFPCANAP